MKGENNSTDIENDGKEAAGGTKIDRKLVLAIGAYALCSSSMLLINKVAVNSLPAPTFVLLCQLVAATVAAFILGKGGYVAVDELDAKKLRAFLPASLSFLGVIFSNLKVSSAVILN